MARNLAEIKISDGESAKEREKEKKEGKEKEKREREPRWFINSIKAYKERTVRLILNARAHIFIYCVVSREADCCSRAADYILLRDLYSRNSFFECASRIARVDRLRREAHAYDHKIEERNLPVGLYCRARDSD